MLSPASAFCHSHFEICIAFSLSRAHSGNLLVISSDFQRLPNPPTSRSNNTQAAPARSLDGPTKTISPSAVVVDAFSRHPNKTPTQQQQQHVEHLAEAPEFRGGADGREAGYRFGGRRRHSGQATHRGRFRQGNGLRPRRGYVFWVYFER